MKKLRSEGKNAYIRYDQLVVSEEDTRNIRKRFLSDEDQQLKRENKTVKQNITWKVPNAQLQRYRANSVGSKTQKIQDIRDIFNNCANLQSSANKQQA